jgi:hypothetical protein
VIIFFFSELAAATGEFAEPPRRGRLQQRVFTVPLRCMGGSKLTIKKIVLESMQGQTEFLHLQEVQVLVACRHVNLTDEVAWIRC